VLSGLESRCDLLRATLSLLLKRLPRTGRIVLFPRWFVREVATRSALFSGPRYPSFRPVLPPLPFQVEMEDGFFLNLLWARFPLGQPAFCAHSILFLSAGASFLFLLLVTAGEAYFVFFLPAEVIYWRTLTFPPFQKVLSCGVQLSGVHHVTSLLFSVLGLLVLPFSLSDVPQAFPEGGISDFPLPGDPPIPRVACVSPLGARSS